MNMPPIVSPQEWDAAREEMLVKEKELTRARDALAAERRRMPRMAVEKDYAFEGPDGPASLLDLFEGRRQLIVYRFFFEPGVARLARERLPRLLLHGRPGRPPRPPELARHHVRERLARAAGRHRALEGADGLGHPLVHDHRRLRRRLRRRRVARHQRVLPRRRGPDLPHLLRRQARRRGARHRLELPRHHRARPPGGRGRTRPRATRRASPTCGGTSTTSTTRPPTSSRAVGRRGVPARRPGARDRARPRGGRAGGGAAPALAGTAAVLLARAWLALHLRRRRGPARDRRRHACASNAPSRRPPRRSSTRGPARRSCAAGGRPSAAGRRARPRSTCAWAARCGWSCATPRRRRARRRRQVHRDRAADPARLHLDLGRRHAGGR